jgi:Cys-tRNA(Pro)/Cys-tRNA(Cys) deacylase
MQEAFFPMPQPQKTNAMRMLERAGIPYKPVYYEIADEEFCGEAVSQLTGIPPEQSFKTLCAKGEKRGVLVFVIPVDGELDLKAAAVAAQDKRVELVHVKELLALTGYVRGGVSPVGMKKLYPTYFDETALLFDEIAVSGGTKGCTLLVEPQTLLDTLNAQTAPLTR